MADLSVTRIALLIDADNLSGDVIGQAVEHLLKLYGAVHFRRAYASPQKVIEHSDLFRRLAIRPMVNVPTGKNSTDIALAVDAIDLAICERPDVVVIASSDSDYAPLAQRLREKGCTVLGIGQAGKTGAESPLAYDEFIDLTHRGKREAGMRGVVATPATPATTAVTGPRTVQANSGRATRRGTSTRNDADSGVRLVSDAASVRPKRSPPISAPKPASASVPVFAPVPAPTRLPATSTSATTSETTSATTAATAAATTSTKAAAKAAAPLPAEVRGILDALPALRGGHSVGLGEVGEALRRLGVLKGKRASVSGYLKRHAAWFELLPADRPRTVRYFGADHG